jgi:hypothetical protein
VVFFRSRDKIKHVRPNKQRAQFLKVAVIFILD